MADGLPPGHLLQPGRAAEGDQDRGPLCGTEAGGLELRAGGERAWTGDRSSHRLEGREKPGYPRFKGRGCWDSSNGRRKDGARGIRAAAGSPALSRASATSASSSAGRSKVWSRPSPPSGRPGAGTWCCRVTTCPPSRWSRPPAAAGIDMGVASFATTSDGTHLPNPRRLAAAAGRLAAAQRDLARKKRGSSRRKKAVARVAGLHGKVRRQRLDHAHNDRPRPGPCSRPDRPRGPQDR